MKSQGAETPTGIHVHTAIMGCMSPSGNGLEQIAGDGRVPLESKTGIDLQINSHQAKYRWLHLIALPLSLYPCLKSNLAAGFKCFLNWWTQWSLMNEKNIIMRRTMRIRIRIRIQIKTTINWKWILGSSLCFSGQQSVWWQFWCLFHWKKT